MLSFGSFTSIFIFVVLVDVLVSFLDEFLEVMDLTVLDGLGEGEEVIVDGEGLLGELRFPELSVDIGDLGLDTLDGESVLGSLSGDTEPVDLLGEGSVVGEDRDVRGSVSRVGDLLEDGSVFAFVITSSKVSEEASALFTSR